MSKRSLILMCSMFLIVPLLFMGCGNDGATGATGATGSTGGTGATGATGPAGPGTVSNESCVVCHGAGNVEDVRTVHNINTDGTKASMGSVTATINSVTFGTPAGDNVPVSVTFTMVAKSVNGSVITNNIDLTKFSGSGSSKALSYVGFYIARMVPGQTYANGAKDPNEWNGYVLTPGATGSGPFSTQSLAYGGTITSLGSGQYTYTFPDNAVRVSDGYVDSLTHRVGMQIYSLPSASFWNPGFSQTLPAPFANATKDAVPNGGALLTRDIVTTAACGNCHDPLGFHSGGARYDTKVCVACHNPNITAGAAGWDNASMVKFIHGIHYEKNLGTAPGRSGPTSLDFTEVTYPQDIRNCNTCHKGTDGANWKNLPSLEACVSCHTTTTFTAGGNHPGGAFDNNMWCSSCHTATSIANSHATDDSTFDSAQLHTGLATFEYNIASVTVDSTNRPVVKFSIKKNGTFLDTLNTTIPPAGFTGNGPAFLVAYAKAQDGVSTPADYNNLGNGNAYGQPVRVYIKDLQNGTQGTLSAVDGSHLYTGVLAGTTAIPATFPAGATMRAVALQGYWSQINAYDTNGDGVPDNVRRAVPSVVKEVTGDAVRRVVVKSGYNATTGAPEGCLECHEILKLHGSNRVNNVQVCVTCHNTSNDTADRTTGINEVWNFKELVHGIHSAIFPGFTEVTYPGDTKHCTKCHIGTSYKAAIPANVLLTTVTGTGSAPTDQVNSPTASACFYCHFTSPAASHMVQNGGDIMSTRTGALQEAPWDVIVTP